MTDLVQLTYFDETTQTEKDCYPVVAAQATRNIGEIVASTIPLTDAGLHLLDGALIQGDGIYSAFVDYIAGLDLTANYFCTEQEWQTAVTTYGVCGKFVYDRVNNTVRLPKFGNQFVTDVPSTIGVAGNGYGLGLVDTAENDSDGYIKYLVDYASFSYSYLNATDGFTTAQPLGTSNSSSNYGFTDNVIVSVCTNKNLSGLIADTSDIHSVNTYYYIVVATSTKTSIEVDIDNVVTDLNGKVDKSSLQEVQCVVETYQNGTSWYRVYSDGWCEQGGTANVGANSQYNGTFLKPFIDTNITFLATDNSSALNGNVYGYQQGCGVSSNSTFFLRQSNDTTIKFSWQASGYIEV